MLTRDYRNLVLQPREQTLVDLKGCHIQSSLVLTLSY